MLLMNTRLNKVSNAGRQQSGHRTDYPYAEGFTQPVAKAREALASLSARSVDKILDENAVRLSVYRHAREKNRSVPLKLTQLSALHFYQFARNLR